MHYPSTLFFFLRIFNSSSSSRLSVPDFFFPPAINIATTRPKINGGKKNMLQGKRI